jgi:short-chain fatty acids transporter
MVRLVDRYLPDPFVFVLILTLVVFAAAVGIEGRSPLAVARMWGDGLWELLTFSMQMLLVLVTGFMLASTPSCAACSRGWRVRPRAPAARSSWSPTSR